MSKYPPFIHYRFDLLEPEAVRDKQLADRLFFRNLSYILDSSILRQSTDSNFAKLVAAC